MRLTPLVITTGALLPLVALAGPATAAVDGGTTTCDKVYINQWQYDATHVKVRWQVKRCDPANAPRIHVAVTRSSTKIFEDIAPCPVEGKDCTLTKTFTDPSGSQTWGAFGQLYESGSAKAPATYFNFSS